MASDEIALSSGKAWKGKIYWSSEIDIANNCSYLYVYAGMWKTDGYTTSSSSHTSGTITINGSTYDLTGYQEFKDEVCIFEDTITIYHNDDGNKSVSISLSCKGQANTSLSGATLSGSGTAVLDQIPRTSSFKATDAAIGSVSTITIYRASTALKHRIKAEFNGVIGYVTNTGGFQSSAATISGDSVAFTIPNSFYAGIPNATKGTCKLTLYTLSGGTVIGDTVTTTIEITTVSDRCNPTLTMTVTHESNDTAALTGNSNAFIRGYSNAKCTVNATARFSATISKVWCADTYVKNADGTYTVKPVNSDTITFYAQDSRGYTGSVSVKVTLVPYVVLTNGTTAGRPKPTDGSAFIQFQGQYFKGSFGAVNNVLTVKYKIERPDGTIDSSWTSVIPTISDDSYFAYVELSGFEYTKVYKVHTEIADKLITVSKVVAIKQGLPIFDWGKEDVSFHVEVKMDGKRITGLGAPVDNNDALRKCDVPNPFPVGAIYMSTKSTSPATLFGGSWTRIQGRFLLGANSSYSAGTTGGEASHTLTVDEMPSHNHWGVYRPDWYLHGETGQASGISNGANNNQLLTDRSGGGGAHNNMPPYLSVYMWERTA